MTHAVEDISGRLERLEGELRTHARSQTGNVKEIAEQVAQLSHVVELLAGAVGETGQVKRLEAQIAALTQLVSQGPRIDLGALTRRLDDLAATIGRLFERQDGAAVAQRLDDVTATMGRLADLQVQFANRVDASTQAASGLGEGLRRIEAGVRDSLGSAEARLAEGMRALENGVRNVYDRIDAIEKSTAMPSLDLDRLTEEMARFTEAMKNLQQPHELIELADVLHQRIAALENDHREVGGLKADVEALRTAVIEAVEPRFAALEMQLEALSDRVGERPADISVGQLEAQVRQLVARMDQTGEQLTGLARLYRQPVEREPAPDFAALADMVAARTSEAVAQQTQPHATGAGLDEAGIDEIERRISRLVNAAALEKPSDDLAGIETSIREVNERLARLEASLAEQARQGERDGWPRDEGQADHHLASVAPPAPEPDEPEPTAPFAGPPDVAATPAHEARPMQPPPRGDAMPANPAREAPLIDRPFVGGVRAALEVKNGTRKLHPGLTDGPPAAEDAAAARPVPGRPLFDPST
ncbi:MAG TPA: hypothetical protein GYA10_13660, partial [Alphaproteobacteria bacterium]|nr:hypothetical protein [Alphaproteobacteria bacterium]